MTIWIDVSITEGLFPSERVVQLRTVNGPIDMFVSSSQVDETRRQLRVHLLDQDDRYALVQVPSQGGGTIAKVERSAVRELR